VEVPVVTEWQGYTPTFQGFGTPTAIEFEWRQVGQDVEIRGKFTAGTTTAVEARVGLPGGLTSAGTDIIQSLQIIGNGGRNVVSAATSDYSVLIEPSSTFVNFGVYNSTVSHPLAKQNGNAIVDAGHLLSFFAKVPCSGLSATTTKTIDLTQSGLVQNPDFSIKAAGNAGQALTSNVTNIPFITQEDTAGAWNGSQFTVPETGVYNISGMIYFTGAVSGTVNLFKNGTFYKRIAGVPNINIHTISGLSEHFTAGEVISLRFEGTGTLNNTTNYHWLSITRQTGLKQVSVSSDQKIKIPTSELRFEGASSRGAVATTIVRFTNIAKIRGDAFTVTSTANDGTFVTMKKAGLLDVTASLVMPTATTFRITKNQTNLTSSGTASEIMASNTQGYSGTANGSIAYSGFVSVGDIIRLTADANPTSFDTNSFNLSFQEQDIAVSVTNTLPQFSESDSSVRVHTANGFGSTNTQVRRFSNILNNIGQDIVYSDSATLGASFTVLTDGLYYVSLTESATTASANVGIVRNATSLLDTFSDIARERHSATAGEELLNCSNYVNLVAGDVIRCISTTAAFANERVQFTISKVGKPNVTGVDVTPFVNIPQNEAQETRIVQAGSSLLDRTNEIQYNLSTASITSNRSDIISIQDDTANTRTKFVALKKCVVDINWALTITTVGVAAIIYKNGSTYTLGPNITSANYGTSMSTRMPLEAGEFFTVGTESTVSNTASPMNVTFSAEAASDSIITASESFSTDTASLQYASSSQYTLSTLANAPVGTFITFTYAASTNTRTQTTTAPTQTTADMNVNGIRIYGRPYNAASTAAEPATIAVQIGKGHKGINRELYRSVGKVGFGRLDPIQYNTSVLYGATVNSYNEVTGILYIDCGYCNVGTVTFRQFEFEDASLGVTNQNNGYLVINASKSPALVGVPLLQPRIATLSDVKAANTAGGSSTSGSWQTRTLNTLVDPTGIVTSLASNQFVLPAGTYYIEAITPAGASSQHKCKIYNVTDATDALLGTSAQIVSSSASSTDSTVKGHITISSAKTFELQHRVGVSTGTSGYGYPSNFGVNEIYSVVKIQKIK
jgi:hypothetical protein